jgi:hypothetical protein
MNQAKIHNQVLKDQILRVLPAVMSPWLDDGTRIAARMVCKKWRDRIASGRFNPADLCIYAARNGYLEVLKWARANGCPWNEDTCAQAAWGGHLEVLQWARANGCPWNEDTCAYAARGGHLEVLQWARANGCTWDWRTCACAADEGHLDVLKWTRANGCPCGRRFHCL